MPVCVHVCVCDVFLCVSLSMFVFYVSDTMVISPVLCRLPVEIQDGARSATDTQHTSARLIWSEGNLRHSCTQAPAACTGVINVLLKLPGGEVDAD